MPDGTSAAGYTKDAWEKRRVVCLVSFHGEYLGCLPIQRLDFRPSADRIRRRPDLSENLENQGSCSEPHYVARSD